MRLAVGTRLGSYEIVGTLGAGGMGEVYRARDTALGREVAIKVLAPAFASDPERLTRFEREARVLASLNHPNVGAIYGIERQAASMAGEPETSALVLELVEGDTLADRLARKRPPQGLPIPEAAAIARQVIEALDAAHEKGIVHRDLKPANIKITAGGVVKVLDFGIAKAALDRAEADTDAMPTITGAATRLGQVIGTPAYMSPEQARGRAVDKRTDIWAFGCVLYEMLTGTLAFPGETISDAIAATLERDPDWSLLPPATPSGLRRLLRRCLTKDPGDRLRDIADARLDLAPSADADAAAVVTSQGFRWTPPRALAALVAGLLLLVASAVAGRLTGARSPLPGAPVQFWMNPPRGAEFLRGPNMTFFALSPDGAALAFVVREPSGLSRIWLRALSVLEPRPLAGTDAATSVFWSPDGRSLGFFTSDKLKRIDLERNAVITVCDAPPQGANFSGTWGADDRMLFAPISAEAIYSVAAGGGTPTVEVAEADGHGVRFPWFLPDGKRFLYVSGKPGADRIVMLAEQGQPPRPLLSVASNAQWVDPDVVVFTRADGTLLAQRVDLSRGQTIGQPFAIAPSIDYALGPGRAMFAVSRNGTVVYQPQQTQRLVQFDRTGQELGQIGQPGDYLNIQLSPDANRLLYDRMQMGLGTYDIGIADLTRDVQERVTTDPGNELGAVWLAGGRAVAFSSGPGARQLFRKDLTTGVEAKLIEDGDFKIPSDVSPDGGTLAFQERAESIWGLWVLGLEGEAKRASLHRSSFNQWGTRFSPNGRFVAFTSSESGHEDVYVAPFPAGAKSRVSPDGGTQPRWSRNGDEIYYIAADGRLMSVPVTTTGDLRVGVPVTLFRTGDVTKWVTFDVFPDDKRFVAVVPPAGAAVAVVQHVMSDAGR